MYYTFKDHQGSLAAVSNGNTTFDPSRHLDIVYDRLNFPKWVVASSSYPLRRNDYGVRNRNRRLFGGKELQDEALAGITLNLYDFEARTYDPTIGRFLNVDPLAEKYYGLSPFAYCGNDPVNAVDLHGDSISITYKTSLGENSLIYNNGLLFNSNNSVYDGEISGFLLQSVCALNTISGCEAGNDMIIELQSSTNMFTIEEDPKSGFKENQHNKAYAKKIQSNSELYKSFLRNGEDLRGGSPGTVNWNPEGRLLPTTKGDLRNGTMDLAHELSHALDSNRGLLDLEKEQGIPRSEWQAVCRENTIRKQLNYPLRTHYKTSEDPSGTYRGGSGVKVLTEKNQPIVPYWYKL